MVKDTADLKRRVIEAGYKAVEHLIKVAEEKVIKDGDYDDESSNLAADRLKNAAAAKKIAIFDAFEILSKIEAEKEILESDNNGKGKVDSNQGFAERRSRQSL